MIVCVRDCVSAVMREERERERERERAVWPTSVEVPWSFFSCECLLLCMYVRASVYMCACVSAIVTQRVVTEEAGQALANEVDHCLFFTQVSAQLCPLPFADTCQEAAERATAAFIVSGVGRG